MIPHCHWTYTTSSGYRSPWYWPTRADAESASAALPTPGGTEPPQIHQVHAPACTCETETQEVPA